MMFSIMSTEKLMNSNSNKGKMSQFCFLNLANSWEIKINPKSPQFLLSKSEENKQNYWKLHVELKAHFI